jgi:SprT-like protein
VYAKKGCHVHHDVKRSLENVNDQELQKVVEGISKDFFDKPFLHRALFNSRLKTTGGRYLLSSHNIEVNKKYLDQLGMDELISIIKHELCHYHLHQEGMGYKHQDKDFKDLLLKVGGSRYCSPLPETSGKRRENRIITYICIECKEVYKRKKKLDTNRYVCGRCSGKLILTEG